MAQGARQLTAALFGSDENQDLRHGARAHQIDQQRQLAMLCNGIDLVGDGVRNTIAACDLNEFRILQHGICQLLDFGREGGREKQALPLCDLFLPSLEDITALTGLTDPQAIIAWSHAQGAQQVVLKLGAEGALASDGQTQRRHGGGAGE